jgi:hypothetical protein
VFSGKRERARERGKEMGGRGGHRGAVWQLQGVFSAPWVASRRWRVVSPASNTQVLAVSTKKTVKLQKGPWFWGVFWRNSKQHPFARFGESNLFQKSMETSGLPCQLAKAQLVFILTLGNNLDSLCNY